MVCINWCRQEIEGTINVLLNIISRKKDDGGDVENQGCARICEGGEGSCGRRWLGIEGNHGWNIVDLKQH